MWAGVIWLVWCYCEVFYAAVVCGCAPSEVANGFSKSAWNVVSFCPVVNGPCGWVGCLSVKLLCSEKLTNDFESYIGSFHSWYHSGIGPGTYTK